MNRCTSLLVLAVVALGYVTPSAAADSDKTVVESIFRKWVADFNKEDWKAVNAACASEASIIDGFPPYAWHSCSDWITAYTNMDPAIKPTDGKLTIADPLFTDVKDVSSYLIYPVVFSYHQKGKLLVYKGTWTITLQKTTAGWVINGASANWGGNYTVTNK